jgi:hypothetical protein
VGQIFAYRERTNGNFCKAQVHKLLIFSIRIEIYIKIFPPYHPLFDLQDAYFAVFDLNES